MCEYDKALEYKNKRVKLCEQYLSDGKIDDENALANAYMNRGVTYDTIGQHEESLRDYGKCIAIREELHQAGRLYDIDYIATPLLNKGILLVTGLHDTQGALELFNHAIALLEAEEKLSYSANDTLQRLYKARNMVTIQSP